jgi:uncharacterized SAM-dependent methyltransferase
MPGCDWHTRSASAESAAEQGRLALHRLGIGNFTLEGLREVLQPAAQLFPAIRCCWAPTSYRGAKPATLRVAYDDAAGTTAAFNLNVLTRLN